MQEEGLLRFSAVCGQSRYNEVPLASSQRKIQDTYAKKMNKVLNSKCLFKKAFKKIRVCVLVPLS